MFFVFLKSFFQLSNRFEETAEKGETAEVVLQSDERGGFFFSSHHGRKHVKFKTVPPAVVFWKG